MPFTVRDWMVDLVLFIDAGASVSEALSMMRRRYVHSLIVKKSASSPEYGIITSTDISDKIVAAERNPAEVKVSEIMTSPLITIERSATLKECAELMKKKRIHHLPVRDDNGELVGMISATDFLVAAESMGMKPGEQLGS